MKKLSSLLLLAALTLSASVASAQKYAIINTQELIATMPEIDTVQTKMKAYTDELQSQMESIQVEFNQKYEDYQNKMSGMSEAVKQLKEKELQDLQNRFENFRQTAQLDIQRKQQELMTPVITRAENAIKQVAKAGNYLLVFDDSVGATVYVDEAQVTNILPQVKKQLGIPESAKPKALQ